MKNKNVVKKITAILATACMMVGMLATTAMAKPAENKQGSLTIQTSSPQSSLAGYQFDLYKIANISVDDSTGNMTYTWEAGYDNILTADELADQAAVQAKVAEISNKATGKPTVTKQIAKDSTDITVTINYLNLGYYLVKVTAPEGAAATSDFLVSVPSTETDGSDLDYNPTVTLKTSTVDATKTGKVLVNGKETDNRSGNVGDEIQYTISFHVPDTTGFDEFTYTINDTMSKGLSYVDGSLKVYIDKNKNGNFEEINSSNYTLDVPTSDATSGGTTLKVDFKKNLFVNGSKTGNKAEYPAGAPLKVVYRATITKDAIVTGTVDNKAELVYSNNPGETSSTGTIKTPEVEHYTYHIQLTKTFDPTPGDFSKVKFTIDNVKLKAKTSGVAGEYVVDPNGTANLELSLNDQGILKIYGLAEGTYYLTETKTADGYNLLSNKVKVVIKATYNATTGKLEGTASGSNTIDTTTHFVDTKVVNKKGFTLPSTGGQGMVALVAAGICLMTLMAALMALYMKKHRNA